jgi:hypothetical protein
VAQQDHRYTRQPRPGKRARKPRTLRSSQPIQYIQGEDIGAEPTFLSLLLLLGGLWGAHRARRGRAEDTGSGAGDAVGNPGFGGIDGPVGPDGLPGRNPGGWGGIPGLGFGGPPGWGGGAAVNRPHGFGLPSDIPGKHYGFDAPGAVPGVPGGFGTPGITPGGPGVFGGPRIVPGGPNGVDRNSTKARGLRRWPFFF